MIKNTFLLIPVLAAFCSQALADEPTFTLKANDTWVMPGDSITTGRDNAGAAASGCSTLEAAKPRLALKDNYIELGRTTRVITGWGTLKDNVSIGGKPLRIGSVDFDQGIGVHAPSEIVIPLKNRYRWVTFYAGVSADMTAKGSITVEVWLDGKKVHDTGVMKVKEGPRYISLPVSGGKELKIIGTDAGDGVAAEQLNL